MSWKTNIPLIAILRGIQPEEVFEHIKILIAEGFDTIEIPLNSPNWQKSIAIAVNTFGNKALIGAGTVLNTAHVDELNQLGCKLIVTPNINPAVITQAVKYGMVVCPGCATATEAFEAIDAGAQNLKIFPSVAFGPSYIKALKAVLPKDIPVFAVGGITPDNLHDYINAGCIGAGLGSDLYQAGQTTEITKLKAQAFIKAYKNLIK
ncbi:2-dehydro-3-deoxy-6-phosphogalactonate aldolase [Orbus sturtevantii]|uniref:2-dehydro-3-deoxy-6-phosphogalactonate aldolase n=1 Tax=Orbus sturtevantii TaxID=3074109 RepID=UPI00370D8EDB